MLYFDKSSARSRDNTVASPRQKVRNRPRDGEQGSAPAPKARRCRNARPARRSAGRAALRPSGPVGSSARNASSSRTTGTPRPRRHRLAPRRIGGMAPDHHAVARRGTAQPQVMARQLQHSAQLLLPQEACVVIEKPPGDRPDGLWFCAKVRQGGSAGRTVAKLSAAPVVPVIAESVLLHCTKGASVT